MVTIVPRDAAFIVSKICVTIPLDTVHMVVFMDFTVTNVTETAIHARQDVTESWETVQVTVRMEGTEVRATKRVNKAVKLGVLETLVNVLATVRSDGLGYSATTNVVKNVLMDVLKTMVFVIDVLLIILEYIVTKVVVMDVLLICAIDITEAAHVHQIGKGKHVVVSISFL